MTHSILKATAAAGLLFAAPAAVSANGVPSFDSPCTDSDWCLYEQAPDGYTYGTVVGLTLTDAWPATPEVGFLGNLEGVVQVGEPNILAPNNMICAATGQYLITGEDAVTGEYLVQVFLQAGCLCAYGLNPTTRGVELYVTSSGDLATTQPDGNASAVAFRCDGATAGFDAWDMVTSENNSTGPTSTPEVENPPVDLGSP